MTDVELQIVPGRGVAPLEFGMSEHVAGELVAAWDTPFRVVDGSTRHFRVTDDAFTLDVFVNFEKADALTSFEIWRPSAGSRTVTVRLGDLRLLELPVEDVLSRLRSDGFVVSESDPYFPTAVSGNLSLGFNREGGDDVDEDADDGLSRTFNSVLVAPPSYYD